MKNISSKSFKQYQPNSNKRSISPLPNNQNPPQQSTSNTKSAKKKPMGASPYQKAIKQFETYGKAERKKTSNFLQPEPSQQHNKFRIVTEPVDDRIMHLAQSNIFNSSLAIKPQRKIQAQLVQSSAQIRLNLRQQTNSRSKSRERIYSKPNTEKDKDRDDPALGMDQYDKKDKSGDKLDNRNKCKNCMKFSEELDYLNAQIKRMVKTKELWKAGEITYDEVQDFFKNKKEYSIYAYPELKQKTEHKVQQNPNKFDQHTHTSIQVRPQARAQQNSYKFADTIVNQIRSTIADLVSEVESLAFIDYPKMLQMQIFKHEPTYSDMIDSHESQLKDLFGQLRNSIEGKVSDYDTYDTESENNYVKMIMRNLKARLGACLRENLQLRICKAIYEKSQEISDQSQEYLRKVIEEVLQNYTAKPKKSDKDSEKQKSKQKKI